MRKIFLQPLTGHLTLRRLTSPHGPGAKISWSPQHSGAVPHPWLVPRHSPCLGESHLSTEVLERGLETYFDLESETWSKSEEFRSRSALGACLAWSPLR